MMRKLITRIYGLGLFIFAFLIVSVPAQAAPNDLAFHIVATSEPHPNWTAVELIEGAGAQTISTTISINPEDTFRDAYVVFATDNAVTSVSYPCPGSHCQVGNEFTYPQHTNPFVNGLPITVAGGPFTPGQDVTVNLGLVTNNDLDSDREFAHIYWRTIGDTENVTIGEVVTYRIEYDVPEGVNNNITIVANIPSGMEYIAGSATTSFTNNTAWTDTPTISGGGAPDTDVTFDFGTITNTDSDANSEIITIEYRAIVSNVVANQDGVSLVNSAQLNVNAVPTTTSATRTVTVIEANLTTSQTTIEPLTGLITNAPNTATDAGDVFEYRMTLTNTGTAIAYNPQITVTMPLTYLLESSCCVGTGIPQGSVSGSNIILATWTQLEPGQSVGIWIQYTVLNTVEPRDAWSITPLVTYASIPNNQGTNNDAPGVLGAQNGGRNEADGVGGALNDYAVSMSSTMLTVPEPTHVKHLEYPLSVPVASLFGGAYTDSTSDPNTGSSLYNATRPDLAIGETFSYIVTITFNEGSIENIALFDFVSPYNVNGGHQFRVIELLSQDVIHVGSNLSGVNLPVVGQAFATTDVNGDGDGTLIPFPNNNNIDITNTPDNVVDDRDRIVFRVFARLDDEDNTGGPADDLATSSNNDGGFARNVVQFTWIDNIGSINRFAQADLDIVEPNLTISKTTSTPNAQPGDTVTFTLTVNNTGNAPAHDVIITDTLPFLGVDNYMSFASVNTALSTCDNRTGYSATTGTPISTFSFNNLLVGESCTLVINATFNANTTSGSTYTNTASATYQSRAGSPLDVRAYTSASATANVTYTLPTITFNDVVISEATANGTLTVSMDITRLSDVTIPFTVAAGVPAATGGGIDYTLANGSVTITAGNLSNTIPFTINNDLIDEPDEIFVVTLGAVATLTIPDPNANVTITDDDVASLILDISTLGTINEDGATTTTFTIAPATPPTQPVSVDLTTDGQCTVNPDPVILPANVTTPVIVTVTAVDDVTAEAISHLCNISAVDVTSADPFYDALTGGVITPFDVTVLDNDIVFTVTNSGAVNEGTGANTTITYTITPNGTIANVGGSVTYTITDTSTTTDISDFSAPLPTNVVLNFAQGSGAQNITVDVVGDMIAEPAFVLELTSSASTSGTTGTPSIIGLPSVLNVADDDVAGVSITQSDGISTVVEAGATDTITITLNTQPDALADVQLTITPDAQCEIDGNGASTPAVITIPNANWNTGTSFTISAIDDLIAEGAHTCVLTVSTPTSADLNYNGVAVPFTLDAGAFNPTINTIPVAVTDDDTASLILDISTLGTINEEGITITTFTIAPVSPPTQPVSVDLNTDGQCTVNPDPVILPANVTTPVIVTVTAVDDATAEATSHLCTISAVDVTSADPFYDALTGGAITPFDVTVLDNDIVFTVTNSGAVNEGTGANTTITYTITPNGTIANVGGSVTYTITDTSTTTDASDFSAPLPTNVVLNFAQGSGAQNITVDVVGDMIAEPAFVLELTSSASTSGTTGTPSIIGLPSVLNVADDDTVGISITQSDGASAVIEGGATDTITITLNTQPDALADVQLTITPDAQCEIDGNGASTPAVITIPSANWNAGASFTISAIDDLIAEGAHTCILTVSIPTSTDPNYNGVAVPITLDTIVFDPATDTITVAVADNDTPGASFSAATIAERTTGSYTIVLNTLPSDTVTVDVITPDAQCIITTATPLTFTVADWNVPQTITVDAFDDGIGEANHSCVINHTLNSTDPAYAGDFPHTITITDPVGTPQINLFDPAISKVGILLPGELGILGERLEWIITVTNNGAVTGNNVVVTDTLRDELRVDAVTTSKGTGIVNGQTVTVTIGDIAPNEVITITIQTTVLDSDVAIDNSACVNSTNASTVCTTSKALNGVFVKALPATGETPWWRDWLIVAGMFIGVVMIMMIGIIHRKQRTA